MKKGIYIMIVLITALSYTCFAAKESIPDGFTYSAYRVIYNEESLEKWETVQYFEPYGYLFGAFTDGKEISVSVNERKDNETLKAHLESIQKSAERYARMISESVVSAWQFYENIHGLKIDYRYRYIKGHDTDNEYHTSIYAYMLDEKYVLTISFNQWGEDRDESVIEFENGFLSGFRLESVNVTPRYLAYLKGAAKQDGDVLLTVDFCVVEYDPEIFTIYTVNDSASDHTYRVSADCMIWGSDITQNPYALKRLACDAEQLDKEAKAYFEANNMYGIYNVVLNEYDEIVWMMHYNAF